MPTYTPCPPDVTARVASIITRHYPELAAAGVTVSCVWAHAALKKDGTPKGPALKHHGWPAAAIVRINPEKARADGMADATICLDWNAWDDEWSDRRREAVLRHEVHHLLVAYDKDGNVRLDGMNRPKLKMRPHDQQLGVFYEIMEEYGADAIDTEVVSGLWRELRQREFDFEGAGAEVNAEAEAEEAVA